MAIASNTNCKPSRSKKATSCSKIKVVPYDEMERLMNDYGALTAVRNRGVKPSKKGNEKGSNVNGVQVKRESIKRKFYRWFPDLEERFKHEDGQYNPIHGHEHEVSYRRVMRANSMQTVAKKRAVANKKNNCKKGGKVVEVQGDMKIELPRADQPLPELISSRGAVFHIPPPPKREVTFDEEQDIIASLVSEDEDESSTIDDCFHASEAIFDEVDKEFYGDELPSVVSMIESESSNYIEKNSLDVISSSSSSSSWEDDVELWDDGFFGIQFEPGNS